MMKSIKDHFFGEDEISKRSWFKKIHIMDWVVVVVLMIIPVIFDWAIPPYKRYIPDKDPSITYPGLADTVPLWALLVVCFLLPLIFLGIFQIYYRSGHDFHHAALSLYYGLGFTFIFTEVIKLSCGRLRPDYWALMDDGQNVQAVLSFPSGHSSLSFAAMTTLSLYMMGKFHILSIPKRSSLLKATISLVPFILSCYIAISRTRDYHHDFSDILAGAILGSVLSSLAYFLYFPSIFNPRSHQPKSFVEDPLVVQKQEVMQILTEP